MPTEADSKIFDMSGFKEGASAGIVVDRIDQSVFLNESEVTRAFLTMGKMGAAVTVPEGCRGNIEARRNHGIHIIGVLVYPIKS